MVGQFWFVEQNHGGHDALTLAKEKITKKGKE